MQPFIRHERRRKTKQNPCRIVLITTRRLRWHRRDLESDGSWKESSELISGGDEHSNYVQTCFTTELRFEPTTFLLLSLPKTRKVASIVCLGFKLYVLCSLDGNTFFSLNIDSFARCRLTCLKNVPYTTSMYFHLNRFE